MKSNHHKSIRRLRPLLVLGLISLTCGLSSAANEGVAVGDSDLITTLDYSDTWTLNGTSRLNGPFPVSSAGLVVENNYGNTSESWPSGDFSLNTDSSASNDGAIIYPGNSGAGSSTGLTQTGGSLMAGIGYGLRTNFVVQSDIVLSPFNTANIGIGSSATDFQSSNGLEVLFNPDGSVNLYNSGVGSTVTTLLSPVTEVTGAGSTWANFAVNFNLTAGTLTAYVNETDLGTIDLSTFDSGAYAAVLNSTSNADVVIGGNILSTGTGNRTWSDNFQVGAVPEPSTYAMLLGGAALLILVRRFRSTEVR